MIIDAAWRTRVPVATSALVRAASAALAETEAAGTGARVDAAGRVHLGPSVRAAVTVEDISSEDEFRAHRAAGTIALDGGPLVRIEVVRVAGEHAVRVLAHHAVLDGYSVTRVFRRIVERLHSADGPPLPHARLGDRAALAAETPPPRPADVTFWSAATDGVGEPGRPLGLADRAAAPADHPLQHRARLEVPVLGGRRVWPVQAVGAVAGYTARYLGTDAAHIGITASLRRTELQRSTPTQWTAVVPTRLPVPAGATAGGLGAAVRDWLGAVAHRITLGERPDDLLTAIPAAWRLGRLYGPVVNVLPDVAVPGWTLDVAAWGPVSDCLLSVYPEPGDRLVVDGVFHPSLYDARRAAAHVDAIAGFLRATLAEPDAPLPAVATEPADPDRIPIPGGWAVPHRIREALHVAGFAPDAVELRTEPPVTVVLHGVSVERLAAARAVLAPGVRVRAAA